MKAHEMLHLVHEADRCRGEHCPFHNPSDHKMADWDVKIRFDRWDLLTERICPHGVGHPDPDCLSFLAHVFGQREAAASSVHGCDGCCLE